MPQRVSHRRSRVRGVVLGALLVRGLTYGPVAHADPVLAVDQRALDVFEESMALYNAGRFREAIDGLQEAYRLRPEPVILYDLARCYEGLGDPAAAASSYRAFLAGAPNVEDRGSIEQRIQTLDTEVRERAAAAKLRDRTDSSTRSPSVVPWVTAGVGAAGLIAATTIGILAKSKEASSRSESQVAGHADNDSAKSLASIANVGFVVGGVVLAGGLVWLLLDHRKPTAVADALFHGRF